MQSKAARVGVVVEGGGGGGHVTLNAAHGAVVGGGVDGAAAAARRYVPSHHQQIQQQQQQQQLHHHSQIGTVSHLLAGGVAGAFSKTCTAPLARLTILFQVKGMHSDVATLSKTTLWREASRIVCEEGFRAFWKGNLVTIAHRLPYSSISFYAYERYKTLLQSVPLLDRHRDDVSADVCVRLIGGGFSGITAAAMTYPLDLVRTRLAAQAIFSFLLGLYHNGYLRCVMGVDLVAYSETKEMYYRGISQTLYTIWRDEGIRGLYKGLGATLLGVGPSIAISFSVYETLRSHWQLQRPCDSPVLVSLACGSVSGIASSTVTFPIDLVRRRMQLEGVGGRARVYNSGLLGTFRHIFWNEGIRGLYRGILPEFTKVVPSVGIVFMTYETLKTLLTDAAADD
ncbi:Mitochondrial adenine nucleotide transporter ADNT1 [Acorus calamus]|uniref:Mitochondrial adenine nucleotide transporter ADNT1 n=1 Tax=Acorus calamus TaxID=4465 RepID=A0AAV9DBN9_ACOCL|nr:Mitochondrial adenine nucleotide transporter ADNT1 [Acorus calamus]